MTNKLTFTKGDLYGPNGSGIFTAGIHVVMEGKSWHNQIECYGWTSAMAETLRDEVLSRLKSATFLAGLNQPGSIRGRRPTMMIIDEPLGDSNDE